jgi:hypothetical protein
MLAGVGIIEKKRDRTNQPFRCDPGGPAVSPCDCAVVEKAEHSFKVIGHPKIVVCLPGDELTAGFA